MKRRNRALDDLDRDIQDHLEREIADNIERGMSPDEARAAALRKFGNVTSVKEATREVWRHAWLEQSLQDLRYGVRMLRRSPGFAAVVILTLALGIGMNTAVFSVVNAVLYRPLAYPHAERLVWMADYFLTKSDFAAWQQETHSYDALAGYWQQDMAVAIGDDAGQERAALTAGDFWNLTGMQPALGRVPGANEPNAVVISHGFFERRFGGDAQRPGKAVDGGRPPGDGSRSPAVSIPIPLSAPAGLGRQRERSLHAFSKCAGTPGQPITQICAVARLKPDVAMSQARAELVPIEARLAKQHPSGLRRGAGLVVGPLQEKIVGGARQGLTILLTAVGFVWLIAGVNIANLLMARASTRQREIAIRAAMGAGRARVIRQFLWESTTLALAGGAAGLLVAQSAIALMLRLGPESVPRLAETRIDLRVLVFTLAISIATGMLFGLGPSVTLWKANLQEVLKDAARTSSSGAGRMRLRGLLVSAATRAGDRAADRRGAVAQGFLAHARQPAGLCAGEYTGHGECPFRGRNTVSARRRKPTRRNCCGASNRLPACRPRAWSSEHCGLRWKWKGRHSRGSTRKRPTIGRTPGAAWFRRVFSSVGGPSDTRPLAHRGGVKEAIVINETLARIIGGDPVGRRISGRFGGVVAGVVADFKNGGWRPGGSGSLLAFAVTTAKISAGWWCGRRGAMGTARACAAWWRTSTGEPVYECRRWNRLSPARSRRGVST